MKSATSKLTRRVPSWVSVFEVGPVLTGQMKLAAAGGNRPYKVLRSGTREGLVDLLHVLASFSLTVSRRRTFLQPQMQIRVRLRLTVKQSQH